LLLLDLFGLSADQFMEAKPWQPAPTGEEATELQENNTASGEQLVDSPTARACNRRKQRKYDRCLTRREEWLIMQENNPDKTITELISLSPGCYHYLWAHDHAWLKVHSPQSRRCSPTGRKSNLPELDTTISRKIAAARDELMGESNGSFKRISKYSILTKLGVFSNVTGRLDKMPLTLNALSIAVESKIEFAVRKIAQVAARLRAKNKPIRRSILIRQAFIGRNLADAPKIIEAIELELTRDSLVLNENTRALAA
jgi:hypothetical protein